MKKIFLILVLFFSITTQICFGQNIIKGSVKTIIYKTGATKASVLKLTNADLINVQFKSYYVEVTVISKSKGQNLLGIEENEEWDKIQVSEFDFEKDGVSEIVIAYGDGISSLKLLVYKKDKNGYKQIGEFEGQNVCELSKNKIFIPYGSQGLFNEYSLKNGQFIQSN